MYMSSFVYVYYVKTKVIFLLSLMEHEDTEWMYDIGQYISDVSGFKIKYGIKDSYFFYSISNNRTQKNHLVNELRDYLNYSIIWRTESDFS